MYNGKTYNENLDKVVAEEAAARAPQSPWATTGRRSREPAPRKGSPPAAVPDCSRGLECDRIRRPPRLHAAAPQGAGNT